MFPALSQDLLITFPKSAHTELSRNARNDLGELWEIPKLSASRFIETVSQDELYQGSYLRHHIMPEDSAAFLDESLLSMRVQ